MAEIDVLGFELNSLIEVDTTTDASTGGSHGVEISTAQSRSGTKSFRAYRTGTSTTAEEKGTINVVGAPTSISVRFSLYLPSNYNANDTPLAINFDAAGKAYVAIQNNGGVGGPNFSVFFNLIDATTGAGTSVIGPFSYDTWHSVVIRVTANTGVGQADTLVGRVDSQTSTTASSNKLSAGAASIDFGLVNPTASAFSATTNNNYIDDIIVTNTNADITDDFNLVFMQPNSTSTAGLTKTGGTTNHGNVSDNSDATDVHYTNSTGNIFDIYGTNSGLPSLPPAGTVSVASVYGSIRAGGASDSLTGTSQVFIIQVGGVNSATAVPTTSLTPTTKRTLLALNTRPAGGAWTQADLSNLNPVIGKVTSTLGETFTFQEVWLYAKILITVGLSDTQTTSETASQITYTTGGGGGTTTNIFNINE